MRNCSSILITRKPALLRCQGSIVACPAFAGGGLERTVEIAANLLERHARFQAAHHLKPPPCSILQSGVPATAAELCIERDRNRQIVRHICQVLNPTKVLSCDADNRYSRVVHANRFADRRWLPTESLL